MLDDFVVVLCGVASMGQDTRELLKYVYELKWRVPLVFNIHKDTSCQV